MIYKTLRYFSSAVTSCIERSKLIKRVAMIEEATEFVVRHFKFRETLKL